MADIAPATAAHQRSLLHRLRFPLAAFVVWRLAHLAVFTASGGWPGHEHLFRWDGSWYRRIMVQGYEPLEIAEQPTAFFPLLSWITGAVRLVVRNDLAAALIVTTVASVAAVCLVYLVLQRWRGEETARWGTVLLLAFPTSVFLWLFYTEALLLAFGAAAILAYERDRPALAGMLAAGAALSRVPGILVAVILGVAHVRRHGLRHAAWYALGGLSLIAVTIVQHVQAGDGLAWTTSLEAWHRGLTFPLVPVSDALFAHLEGLVRTEGWSFTTLQIVGSAFDLAATFLFFLLAWLAVRRQWPGIAQAFILLFLIMPLTTGQVLGMGRYVLAAWPAFGVLAETRARVPAVVAFAAFSVATVHDRAVGLFVG